jgi:DNA replication and repair protein RecF
VQLRRLQVQNVRNLEQVSLANLKRINLFHGINGSGKTSLLEAVHLLLVGRPFRSNQLRPVLREGADHCVVFAELVDGDVTHALGMQRTRSDKPQIKLDGERLGSAAELVRLMPLQVLNADAFTLLTGGPGERREFMDWGLFHVEHEFYPVWQRARRALQQRNSLIRHGKIERPQLLLWSREYARYGEELDVWRRGHIAALAPLFRETLAGLSPVITERISVVYSRGWAKDAGLEALLVDGIERDVQQGYTRVGPHRADLRVLVGSGNAAEMLSRGQLKLVVAALRIAQARLLRERTGKSCLVLVDDLSAELDMRHRQELWRALAGLQTQVLITCIDKNELEGCWTDADPPAMFHVEHGVVCPDQSLPTDRPRGIE